LMRFGEYWLTMNRRYNYISEYYKKVFGERTLKICIDGGFTCPNRDGKIGTEGCIFCSEKGSGELIKNNELISNNIGDIDFVVNNISNQVDQYLKSYKAERANKFIVYFQNYSNTYDLIENLKRKYDAAFIDDRIVGLAIATRPDCINDDIAKLISSYTNNYYVSVELGLQTANDAIGAKINRGYNCDDYKKAITILKQYDIDVVTHIMCGLPYEERKIDIDYNKVLNNDDIKSGTYISNDIKTTLDLVNNSNIDGIKIHSTYVVKNTVLENLYKSGDYIPLSLEEYMYDLLYIVTHLSPNMIIHRICADAPKNILVAPEWNLHKKWILNGFENKMRELDLFQGCFYK